MRVIKWRQFLKDGLQSGNKPASITIGIFDGVHLGHQALIKRVVSYNADDGYVPVIFTFRQNHKTKKSTFRFGEQRTENKEQRTEDREQRTCPFGSENRELCDIQSFEERLAVFERLGVQITVVIDFTEEFRRMTGREFLLMLSEHCCVGFFAVGSDFRCGYQLDTDAAAIVEFFTSRKIPVEIAPLVYDGQLPVSSSRIRAAMADGDILKAQTMLGNI